MSTDICQPVHPVHLIEQAETFEPSGKKVRFIMFSSVLNEDNNICLNKTKDYDGTKNEHKRWFAAFVNEFFKNRLLNHQTADAVITKLIGCDKIASKMQFLKYCADQLKIVTEKIEKFNDEIVAENNERAAEVLTKTELEEQPKKTFEDSQFEIKWSSSMYDMQAVKRCKRAVSLIREPSRDMATIKFDPLRIFMVHRILKFVEGFEEELFLKDYIIVDDEL
jgi:hypothetical protein